jgi:phage terminase small subunit
MEPEIKKLTAKEEKFCQEYVLWLNGAKAAINAGYSENTAKNAASRLLTFVNVKERIQYLKDNLAETCGISAQRIAQEHEKIAFSNTGSLRNGWMSLKEFEDLTDEQKSCIEEVSTKETTKQFEGGSITEVWVKIKMYNKQKSLDSLVDMFGYNAPKTMELTGKDGKDLVPQPDLSKLTDDELRTLVELQSKSGVSKA